MRRKHSEPRKMRKDAIKAALKIAGFRKMLLLRAHATARSTPPPPPEGRAGEPGSQLLLP
jgi:hypothetical protein